MHLRVLDMSLSKVKLGELLELVDVRNSDLKYGIDDVKGISTSKCFINSKASLENVSLHNYKIVEMNQFAYVPDTSRRGDKIGLAFQDQKPCIISSIYTTFKVRNEKNLNPYYLLMYFKRAEYDRFSRYNSWGSARETFNWEDFCDTEIELPDLDIQNKYVAIYKALQFNLSVYETNLEDLKLVCEAKIENLRKDYETRSIIDYITERNERNIEIRYENLIGVGNEGFIPPRQQREYNSLSKCSVFYYHDFVYNPSVLYAGAIALNSNTQEPQICTEEYVVFYVSDESVLIPEYLFMWLKRAECGRYIDFMSIDSVRNRVYFSDLEMINIPIPPIDIQKDIVAIHNSYSKRTEICNKLKKITGDICPILIRGAIKEGGGQ